MVIAGRPNVGKSAIFNRIAGRRIAIVHDESGVTRDRLMREVEWEDERFTLIDTGGMMAPPGKSIKSQIDEGIITQIEAALQGAAVVVLVTDVQSGLHPLDEEVAHFLRRQGLPCIVAVNKCDLPQHEEGVEEFARLGFPTVAVAAQHGRGTGELMDAVLPHLPDVVNESVEKPLRVVVAGRPNAGKSSYINRLLRSERVIVSDVAGTTRDSIDVPFTIGKGEQARHYVLVDTAGMRHRHSVDSSVERFSLFRAEQSVAEADVVVLIMDPELGPTVQDKRIASLVQEHKKGCVLLVNKWDLAMEAGVTQTQAEPEYRRNMRFMNYCPMLFISAKSGLNVRRSIDVIDMVAAQTRTRLPTGLLNRTLVDAINRVQTPGQGRRRLRVYYAVQIGVAPVTIRLYVNEPKLATRAYTDFLIRSLREQFGLYGAPIDLRYRARARPDPKKRGQRGGGDEAIPDDIMGELDGEL